MQTFLPYPDFKKSALVLDYRRLGKQRVETKQILNALDGLSKGWTNHPATNMWRGYEFALAYYGLTMCAEWIRRGYNDSLSEFFIQRLSQYGDETAVLPPWMGDEEFHTSHQSNLVRKDPEYYGSHFPEVPDDLPYIWPSSTHLLAASL